jgi:hypothetical protein
MKNINFQISGLEGAMKSSNNPGHLVLMKKKHSYLVEIRNSLQKKIKDVAAFSINDDDIDSNSNVSLDASSLSFDSVGAGDSFGITRDMDTLFIEPATPNRNIVSVDTETSDTYHFVEVNTEADIDDYEPNSDSSDTEEEENDDTNDLEDVVSHHILQDD